MPIYRADRYNWYEYQAMYMIDGVEKQHSVTFLMPDDEPAERFLRYRAGVELRRSDLFYALKKDAREYHLISIDFRKKGAEKWSRYITTGFTPVYQLSLLSRSSDSSTTSTTTTPRSTTKASTASR